MYKWVGGWVGEWCACCVLVWCQRDLRLIKNIYKCVRVCGCNRNVTWLLLLRSLTVIAVVAVAVVVVLDCVV